MEGVKLYRLLDKGSLIGYRIKDTLSYFDINADVASLFSLDELVTSDVRVVYSSVTNSYISNDEKKLGEEYTEISNDLNLVTRKILSITKDIPKEVEELIVFVEDKGSGLDFYAFVLKVLFPHSRIRVKSVDGVGNFDSYISNCRNKKMLIIFDFAVKCDVTFKLVDSIKRKINRGYEISYFTPLSFEEVLLSFRQILNLISSSTDANFLHDLVVNYLESGDSYILNKDVTYKSKSCSVVNQCNSVHLSAPSLEKLLAKYTRKLLASSSLAYTKGSLGNCWTLNCMDNCKHIKECKFKNVDLVEILCNNSLLGGLYNILASELGLSKSDKFLQNWSASSKNRLYGRCY